MTVIRLETKINASARVCFDLARSADAHMQSLAHTKEKAIAGRTSGLFEAGDWVTWEAKHFGIRQHLTVKITKLEPYTMFEDVMVKGAFRSFVHQHHFEEHGGYTLMKDVFTYDVPGWIFGKLFDALVLKRYMTRLLRTRNEALKAAAEKT
jgi:ligand-binding SRPBCC domain-containing protein